MIDRAPPVRVLLVLVVLPLLAARAASGQGAPADGTAPVAHEPGTIEFTEPPFDIPADLRDSIRFGWLTVPQDHDDPRAGTLGLAFTVIAARTADPAPDPIVIIPGGPGSPQVVPATIVVARSERTGLHRRHRTLVLLDPRGHGLSDPHTCPELDGSEPLVEDDDAAETILGRKLTVCRERLRGQGVRLETLSSVQAARDIDLLRTALGAPQVNLIGGSYGTRIVAEAMREVPWAVRSAMMHGPVPPGLPRLAPDDEAVGKVMATLFRRCSERPECRSAFPNLEDDYAEVLARAARAPLIVPVPRSDRVPAGRLSVDSALLRMGLAELGFTRELAAGAPLLIHTLAQHGLEPLSSMTPQLLRMLLPGDLAYGTHLAFHCNDSPVGLETTSWIPRRCPLWIGARYGDSLALPLRSDIPALVLAGELDPRTPPPDAQLLARGLSRSEVVVLPWSGHQRLPDCAFRLTDEFIQAPERAPDTSCVDSIPPIRFASGVVTSRWVRRVVARAAEAPVRVGLPAAAGLLLLLTTAVGVPVRTLARRRKGEKRITLEELAVWGTAVAGVVFALGIVSAVFAGARENVLIPALGVPEGWGWVLVLPWPLLALLLVAVALWAKEPLRTEPRDTLLRWSGVLGAALVLGLWALYSVG